MSATQSKEERRNLRRAIGETAAAAMGECKAAVLDVRTSNLELAKLLQRQHERIAKLEEQVKAALKLGFDNEKKGGELLTFVQKLADEQRRYVDLQDEELRNRFNDLRDRGFVGRVKWLLRGK